MRRGKGGGPEELLSPLSPSGWESREGPLEVTAATFTHTLTFRHTQLCTHKHFTHTFTQTESHTHMYSHIYTHFQSHTQTFPHILTHTFKDFHTLRDVHTHRRNTHRH